MQEVENIKTFCVNVNGFTDSRTKIDWVISSRFVTVLWTFFWMNARESPVLLKDHTTCEHTTYSVSENASRYQENWAAMYSRFPPHWKHLCTRFKVKNIVFQSKDVLTSCQLLERRTMIREVNASTAVMRVKDYSIRYSVCLYVSHEVL